MKETAWNKPNLRHIWTYRWQRHSTATNIAPTWLICLPKGGPTKTTWIACGNLSRRYLCPGKVQQGWLCWALVGVEQAQSPSDDGNTNLLTIFQLSPALIMAKFLLLGFQTAGFPRSAISLVPLCLKISWLGSPVLPFPVYGHTDCYFLQRYWMFSNSLPHQPNTTLISA